MSEFSPLTSVAPWCSGLTCHPVTVEIVGSNPIGVVFIFSGESPCITDENSPSGFWRDGEIAAESLFFVCVKVKEPTKGEYLWLIHRRELLSSGSTARCPT